MTEHDIISLCYGFLRQKELAGAIVYGDVGVAIKMLSNVSASGALLCLTILMHVIDSIRT